MLITLFNIFSILKLVSEAVVSQWQVVNATVVGSIPSTRFGYETKFSVEFRNTTPKVSKIRRKIGKGVS